MLISITESCHMGCSHCMDDAKPCDNHMDFETFKDVVHFFNKYGMLEFVITGGEPTDNPDFLHFLYYAAENISPVNSYGCGHITVTTNGMNLLAKDKAAYNMVLSTKERFGKKVTFQVTFVDKYYPIKINLDSPVFKLPNVVVCTELQSIYPMGRARYNNIPWKSNGSKCFNLRSIMRQRKSLSETIAILTSMAKFCTPQIDIFGNIKLGESLLCPIASNIYKTEEEIVNDIYNFKCRGCDIINNNLSEEHLRAIGER